MSGGAQKVCAKSPTGEHELVNGAVTRYCKHCGLVQEYIEWVSDGRGGRLVARSGPKNPDWPGPIERVITRRNQAKKVAVGKPKKKPDPDPIKTEVIGAIQAAKNRPKVLKLIERDGPFCFYCEHRLIDPREEFLPESQWWPTLDHLMPRVRGGHSELDNLVLACKACNHRKSEHLYMLVEVIKRTRRQRDDALEGRVRDQEYITRMQWELFDAGLGEIPGHTTLTRGKRTFIRPPAAIRDSALHVELDERVVANLRAENAGKPHSRTAAVVKRCRAATGLALRSLDTKGRRGPDSAPMNDRDGA